MVVDTGIIIEHIRAKDKSSTTLYRLSDETEICISSVSMFELYMGATTPQKAKDIALITEPLLILPFNDVIARKAAQIYNQLKKANRLIEFRDMFIAATCLVFEQPIATLNKKHFKRVDGLTFIG